MSYEKFTYFLHGSYLHFGLKGKNKNPKFTVKLYCGRKTNSKPHELVIPLPQRIFYRFGTPTSLVERDILRRRKGERAFSELHWKSETRYTFRKEESKQKSDILSQNIVEGTVFANDY